ncbi:MAG: TolC family protein [Balneolaceae bacterium]
MKTRIFHLFLGGFLLLTIHTSLSAQDTLSVNLTEFIERGLDKSGQVAYERGAVDLARNEANSARSQRIFPRFELSTQHGLIPGVESNTDLPERQYYLDPNLTNDWEDWAIFTRAEIEAVQPVFSWGAITNAIRAAEKGARAAEFEFNAVEAEAEVQFFELYYSYLLALEISRILDDAQSQLEGIEDRIEEMQEEGNSDLEESDIFQFEIFRAEFETQRVEVEQSTQYISRIWNYILDTNGGTVYRPAENFLDPVPFELEDYAYYEQIAVESRPELKGVDTGIDAMNDAVSAARAQQYPMLFLGITGSYANTPNRPRQSNPFIINSTNYASAAVGFGIRQNLNFLSTRATVERAEIERNRVSNLRNAVMDGIILELNEQYREAVVAESRYQQTENALVTARNWVRHEQLNYDYGFGNVENLVDAIRRELELRVELKQNVFELNRRIAALYKASGISVKQLSLN